MSFVTQEDVFAAIEPVLHGVFEEFAGGRTVTPPPFPRIAYRRRDAGSTAPTSRTCAIRCSSPMSTEVFRGSGFGLFAKQVEQGGIVRAIPAPGAAAKPRSFFDKLNEWAREQGAAGLGYIVFEADGRQGADRQEPGRGAAGGAARGRRRQGRRCRVLRLRQEGGGREVRGRSAHEARARSSSSSRRTPSASAGSSISRCTRCNEETARSSSATTRSRCRRAGWRRWRTRTR